MLGAIFVIKIKPGHRDHMIEALKKHGDVVATTEPGCLRFEIFPDHEDENKIWFFEAYEDQAALDTHLIGESHIKQWAEFGRQHCTAEWPPTESTGFPAESIWTLADHR